MRLSDQERIERTKSLMARNAITRPIWIGDDGWMRIGHTDDMRQMLDDLGFRTSAQ